VSALLVIVAIFAWGLWLYPARMVESAGHDQVLFFATAGNLLFVFSVILLSGQSIAVASDWLAPTASGALWSLGGAFAFAAVQFVGPPVAMSIWAPINIIVAVTIGGLFFGEWQGLGVDAAARRAFALCLLVAGLLVIVGWSGKARAISAGHWSRGVACALAAGLLWGLYLVPIQQADIPARLSLLPMACGMFFVSASFLLIRRHSASNFPTRFAWLWLCGSGLLWGLGNVACLLLIERIGLGSAFALCQAALAINALAGVFVLRDRSAAYTPPRRLLTGCGLVLSGGALIGTTLK